MHCFYYLRYCVRSKFEKLNSKLWSTIWRFNGTLVPSVVKLLLKKASNEQFNNLCSYLTKRKQYSPMLVCRNFMPHICSSENLSTCRHLSVVVLLVSWMVTSSPLIVKIVMVFRRNSLRSDCYIFIGCSSMKFEFQSLIH